MEYLIFKKGGKTYCRKIVDHYSEDGSNVHQSVSESIFFDDRLYYWLTSNISAIQNEVILPFEYFNLYQDKLVTLRSYHPITFEIGIYSSRKTFEKNITEEDIEKWSHHFRNLNFEMNTKTVLFTTYQKLEEYFSINDNRFKFLRYFPK